LDASTPLKLGVYVVDTPYGRGVANYGIAPTMGDDSWTRPVLEVHLLDFIDCGGISSQNSVQVEFVRFLRPERKFESTEALCRQIASDIAVARQS
jgi:riboflavin kinase/FMN adenylyltransferase